MKFGVSKILPNSLSKWLSPKVDATSARRRRHEEIDSDDESSNRNNSPPATGSDGRHQATPQLAAPPPNKKKKIFPDILSRNTLDSYSPPATPLAGDRSNIASSTLIENVPHRRNNNQFHRFLPLENGQHASSSTAFAEDIARDSASNYPDEVSSSQSREKPINPFIINNDSSVVNFSAQLQRAKSLFTNRSYVSPRLKNYRMRNPRSSLYRSTSSLCDNNSVSSNASSAMSSPFYNGQTTFGGASATSRRLNTTLNQDLQLYHRPKVPTNLVTSRSTSSLNSIGGSTSMSTTARRILDVMSKYNTPLTEVRRVSNALPSISETSALNKRKSILELDSTNNEIDKTKRSLKKPNTPYNRPFGRNPVESILTTELHVPSMPELLQLKKFATNTMKIRDIASNSDSALNKPVPIKTNEFKITKTVPHRADGDLDVSNNNKSVNNKIDTISNSANETNKQHKNKIRSNLTRRRMGKDREENLMPEPVNLPKIPLIMDKKVEPFKLQTTSNPDNGLQIPFKFKSSNTTTLATSITAEKRTNGNNAEPTKTFEMMPSKPSIPPPPQPANSFDAHLNSTRVDEPINPPKVLNNSKSTPNFRFSEPIVLQKASKSFETKQYNNSTDYKFSKPIFVSADNPLKHRNLSVTPAEVPQSCSSFKFETKSAKGIQSDGGKAETKQMFVTNVSKTIFFGNAGVKGDHEFSAGKSVSSISTEDDSFKSIVAKQKQDKWSCNGCLASNDSSVSKCACCGAAKENEKEKSQPVAVDDVYKAIVAKQKQNKWNCKECMAQNDQVQSKCVCCGESNPNAAKSATTESKTELPKPTFSFGKLPTSSPSATSKTSPALDSVFKSIVDKQKSFWECSACLSRNDDSKSKCGCCDKAKDGTAGTTATETVPAKSQFSFGSNAITATASKSAFLFGSNTGTATSVASTFSFGNLDAKKTQNTFSFGNLKGNASTTETPSNGTPENDKAKDLIQKTLISNQSTFGNSTILPSTSQTEVIPKPAASVPTDNIFKSIVAKQNSTTWECSQCMIKNSNSVEKCMSCEAPKSGGTTKDSAKTNSGLNSSQKYSFGSSSSSSFVFGSKPDNKPSFQFGTPFNSATTTTTTTAQSSTLSTTLSTAVPSTSSAPPSSSFLFSANKPATETTAVTQAPSTIIQFSFGSTNVAAPIFKEVSKDVTDTGPQFNANNKGIKVLENVLVKPATNGPNDTPKPMFSFGQSVTKPSEDDPATKAIKRPNTDATENNILAKIPTTSSAPNASFVFGQPQNANNTFGAIVSPTATGVLKESNAAQANQNPTFSFGTTTSSTFPTAQPSFSSAPFSFNAGSSAATTAPNTFGAAAAAQNPPSQPIFGSNAFSSTSSSLPTLGGFKAAPTFGGSSAPAFGSPASNTEAQVHTATSPAAGVFQFGANNASEKPKVGGFNFSLNATPTFNFSEQNTQQPNVLFQFGSTPDVSSNIFSAPPSTTAIQQRRKLRPVRRVNRP